MVQRFQDGERTINLFTCTGLGTVWSVYSPCICLVLFLLAKELTLSLMVSKFITLHFTPYRLKLGLQADGESPLHQNNSQFCIFSLFQNVLVISIPFTIQHNNCCVIHIFVSTRSVLVYSKLFALSKFPRTFETQCSRRVIQYGLR